MKLGDGTRFRMTKEGFHMTWEEIEDRLRQVLSPEEFAFWQAPSVGSDAEVDTILEHLVKGGVIEVMPEGGNL